MTTDYRPVEVDLDGTICDRCCGDGAEWLEVDELRRRGWLRRVPRVAPEVVDELGLLVAVCPCGHCWWIGPLL